MVVEEVLDALVNEVLEELDDMEEVVAAETCSWFSRVVVTREEQLLLPATASTLVTLARALLILC